MGNYTSGKYALALCDRCGFEYDYLKIREEWNGSRVCPECFEAKHPQLEPPPAKAGAQALRHARPAREEPPVDTTEFDDFINGRP